jgi:hypothetical protein
MKVAYFAYHPNIGWQPLTASHYAAILAAMTVEPQLFEGVRVIALRDLRPPSKPGCDPDAPTTSGH